MPKTTATIKPLDEWIKSIFSSAKDQLSTANLSRFGLENASEVLAFLKSPAGEVTMGEIANKLNIEEAYKEEQRMEQQDHRLLMERLKALLLFWFVEEKVDAASKNRELVLQQIEKILNIGKKTALSNNSVEELDQHNALEDMLAGYDQAIKVNQEKSHLLESKAYKLEQKSLALEVEGKAIDSKYALYHDSLNEIDEMKELNPTDIENHIQQLSTEMDSHVDELNKVIEIDDEAKSLMNKHNAMNLKLAAFHDMLAVHQNKKYYTDMNGDPVSSFKTANFILDRGKNGQSDQRIIKENGTFYLLQPGQDWNAVKDNQEALKKAEQQYDRLKSELMCVKQSITHNQKLEVSDHKDRIAENQAQRAQNKESHLLLQNQLNLLQASRASACNALHQPSPGPIPRPTATKSSASASKPSQATTTLFYKEQIQQIKASELTFEHLFQIAKKAPGDKEAALTYLDQALANRPRTTPIPFTLMQSLLKNLARFGVDPLKPSVTSIESPAPMPTPLSTMPDPYRHKG